MTDLTATDIVSKIRDFPGETPLSTTGRRSAYKQYQEPQ